MNPTDWSKKFSQDQLSQIEPTIMALRNAIGRQTTGNPNFTFVNAPMLAFETVYGKKRYIRGRSSVPQKKWNGIYVDKHLKDKWLNELNSIPHISISSTEEGKSRLRVPAVIFRFNNPENDFLAPLLTKELKKYPDLYVKYDIGMEGRPRICVAGDKLYGQSGWEQWWDNVPKAISNSVKSILQPSSPDKKYLKSFKRELNKILSGK